MTTPSTCHQIAWFTNTEDADSGSVVPSAFSAVIALTVLSAGNILARLV